MPWIKIIKSPNSQCGVKKFDFQRSGGQKYWGSRSHTPTAALKNQTPLLSECGKYVYGKEPYAYKYSQGNVMSN